MYSLLCVDMCLLVSTGNARDYEARSETLLFADCDSKPCMNVFIDDDSVIESDESFLYTLQRTPGLDPRVILDPSAGEVIIMDNDGRLKCVLVVRLARFFSLYIYNISILAVCPTYCNLAFNVFT